MAKNEYRGIKAILPEGKTTTPYNRMTAAWDDYVGEVKRDRRKWQTISIGLCVITILSLGTVFYALSLPKTEPYIIEIAQWGEAKSVGVVANRGINTLPDSVYQYTLRKLIEQIRTVPLDETLFLQNLNKAYEVLTLKSAPVISEELKAEDVYKLFGDIRREVQVESVINITGNAWQADWIETTYGISTGDILKKARMRVIATIVHGEPSFKITSENPLGIFIDTYQRKEIGEVK